MIKHIQDAISYGLYEDFRAEDSTLVAGFHECFGEQLDCEAFSSWPDEKEAGVLHLALGEDKQFKISISAWSAYLACSSKLNSRRVR